MATAATSSPEPVVDGKLPPGPRGSGFFFALRQRPTDWLGFLTRLEHDYGDISFFRLFRIPICFINRPELIESVLVSGVSEFAKSKDYIPLRILLGNGLLTSEGEFWQRQRKLVQPGFHRERIASYSEVMTSEGEKMMASWGGGEVRDIHHDMMKLTLAVVAKTLFGADVTSDAAEVAGALELAMERYSRLAWLAFLFPPRLMTPWQWIFGNPLRRLDSIIYRIISSRRQSKEDRGDLLSMLLGAQAEDGTGMTDRQLRDEVMTLFLAGHETTANALSWTWYLLSQYPAARERLEAELDRVLSGRLPGVDDLSQLAYTQMVLKESLRLFPPAWGVGREALHEIQLDGYRLPAGTNVFISQWVMQRDPRYFERPEEFIPERWAGEFEKRLPKFAYFPFGGGPRVCVGASFATMEASLLLATIAQKFRLSLVPGHPVVPLPSVTLRPKHGIRMTLHARH